MRRMPWSAPSGSMTVLEEGDKFLTLSTCTYSFTADVHAAEAYRFVVMGKLLPEDASGESTASITKNESPKEPQV